MKVVCVWPGLSAEDTGKLHEKVAQMPTVSTLAILPSVFQHEPMASQGNLYDQLTEEKNMSAWLCMLGKQHPKVKQVQYCSPFPGYPWRTVMKANLSWPVTEMRIVIVFLSYFVCAYVYTYIKQISFFHSLHHDTDWLNISITEFILQYLSYGMLWEEWASPIEKLCLYSRRVGGGISVFPSVCRIVVLYWSNYELSFAFCVRFKEMCLIRFARDELW